MFGARGLSFFSHFQRGTADGEQSLSLSLFPTAIRGASVRSEKNLVMSFLASPYATLFFLPPPLCTKGKRRSLQSQNRQRSWRPDKRKKEPFLRHEDLPSFSQEKWKKICLWIGKAVLFLIEGVCGCGCAKEVIAAGLPDQKASCPCLYVQERTSNSCG